MYEDDRGWRFAVRPALGGDMFKGFYRKTHKQGWHAVRVLPWSTSEEEAEKILAEYAKKHKMKEVGLY